MDVAMIIELIGYLGSTLVVVSMLISATYALIIHSYPLALMNICLIVINCYNLVKLLKSEQHYDLIRTGTGDAFLGYFMAHYKQDIRNFFEETDLDVSKADTAYIVCCGANPAGMLLGNMEEEGVLKIGVDYTTPAYRDCSVGKYLYSRLSEQGIRKLKCAGGSEKHEEYLLKMGFVRGNEGYEKTLV